MGNTRKLQPLKLSEEVIGAINSEFHYQSLLQESGRADAVDHGVTGQLVCLRVYLRKAEAAWTLKAGDEPALHEIRKIAAIALRALQTYGCPQRNLGDIVRAAEQIPGRAG
jgi:hypothetical protein